MGYILFELRPLPTTSFFLPFVMFAYHCLERREIDSEQGPNFEQALVDIVVIKTTARVSKQDRKIGSRMSLAKKERKERR